MRVEYRINEINTHNIDDVSDYAFLDFTEDTRFGKWYFYDIIISEVLDKYSLIEYTVLELLLMFHLHNFNMNGYMTFVSDEFNTGFTPGIVYFKNREARIILLNNENKVQLINNKNEGDVITKEVRKYDYNNLLDPTLNSDNFDVISKYKLSKKEIDKIKSFYKDKLRNNDQNIRFTYL